MHLLLMVPSSILLIILFLHSWRYRGHLATLAFFFTCFLFGLLRGNLIHYIITGVFGGQSLPYLFVQPVITLGQASLQECIGWIFALYLSWSTVEWVMGRQSDGRPIGLYRLIGLTAIMMGAISYAVEAAAAAVKWWVWVFPIKNPLFADVPFVGIVAWISVAFDFLMPFLLIRHRVARGWRALGLLLIFPAHMLTHLKVDAITAWMPMSPNEIWHLLMVSVIFLMIGRGGPEIEPWTARAGRDTGAPGSWKRHGVLITLTGFILVLAAVHFAIIGSPGTAISMVPFITGALFFNMLYAGIFALAATSILAALSGQWTFALVPLAVFLIYLFGSPRVSRRLSPGLRTVIAVLAVAAATVGSYTASWNRYQRYDDLQEVRAGLVEAETDREINRLMEKLPSPGKPDDAYHYNSMATGLMKQNKFRQAAKLLEMAMELDSTYANPHVNIAWAWRNLGEVDKAIRAYRKALELNPVDMGTYVLLGEIYLALDSLDRAEELYRRGLSYRKNHAGIILGLESVLYRQGRLDEAVSLLKSRLPESDEPEKLASRLAVDLWKSGRGEDAETFYKRTIREGVNSLYGAATTLSLIYLQERDNPELALEYIRLAAAVNPSPDVYILKGGILEQLGRMEEAREAYRRAEELEASRSGSP